MSGSGQSRRLGDVRVASDFPPIADVRQRGRQVQRVPETDTRRSKASLTQLRCSASSRAAAQSLSRSERPSLRPRHRASGPPYCGRPRCRTPTQRSGRLRDELCRLRRAAPIRPLLCGRCLVLLFEVRRRSNLRVKGRIREPDLAAVVRRYLPPGESTRTRASQGRDGMPDTHQFQETRFHGR
jgi:hypothetical protein